MCVCVRDHLGMCFCAEVRTNKTRSPPYVDDNTFFARVHSLFTFSCSIAVPDVLLCTTVGLSVVVTPV